MTRIRCHTANGLGFSCPPDITCLRPGRGYKCPWDPCPEGRKSCDDGMRCYDSSEICNGRESCMDGSDEFNCLVIDEDGGLVKPSADYVRIVLAVIWTLFVILMIITCVFVVVYRRKRASSQRNARVELQPQGGQGNKSLNVAHSGQQGPSIQHHQTTDPVQTQNPSVPPSEAATACDV